jgi:hypothetical protein
MQWGGNQMKRKKKERAISGGGIIYSRSSPTPISD